MLLNDFFNQDKKNLKWNCITDAKHISHLVVLKKKAKVLSAFQYPEGPYRRAGDFLQEHEVTEQEGMASNLKSVALH